MLVNRPSIGETNGLEDGSTYHDQNRTKVVPWTAKGLKVTRLRMLSDVGFPVWDISYCHGTLNNEPVIVSLPFDQLPKQGYKKSIVKHAIKDKVYAKGLGILDPWVISTLC